MAKTRNHVSINVHNSFYKYKFEPLRKSMGLSMGLNLSQTQFTELLTKFNAKIVIPKNAFKVKPIMTRTKGVSRFR
jgi:hypothetical protein